MAWILRSIALALALGLAAMPAAAAFHLWTMTELYSNADGSVQFLELRALSSGQQFMAGHVLQSSSGNVTNTFSFPANLPGDTSGKRMLIATQGFAALGIVQPDYVVPNGFFFPGGGSIDFAQQADLWNHGPLPAGNLSLNRDGTTASATPRNFAGVTGTLSAPFNVQALWYRSPAESESGWGLNIAHQGDILFATWFTYDADGSGMWLVGPDVRRTGGNTYTGKLYRTTGAPFNAVPWSPASLGITEVGTITLAFTDASNGTFSYVVNGIAQSKPITRQNFGATIPACTAGGAAGAAPNYQDLWYAAPAESEAGWGVNLTHQADILFVTWFTYEAGNKGMWLVGPNTARTAPNTYSGPLYRTTAAPFNAVPWNPASLAFTQVGTATFTFSDASNGTFSYVVDGIAQSKPITRQVFGSPVTVCR